jgi:fusion protein PurCD
MYIYIHGNVSKKLETVDTHTSFYRPTAFFPSFVRSNYCCNTYSAYLTGSTSTSIWKHYDAGIRTYCGHVLPNHMIKNQPLPPQLQPLLTPTTKEEQHDRPISGDEILQEQYLTVEEWETCRSAALALFRRGQEMAATHGLILVDTKYEFGRCCVNNEIVLIDEIHTPDSSRYWIAHSYAARMAAGLEPDNIDKEFLRLWYIQQPNCDPYHDTILPVAPPELVLELSRRYIQLYEMITGQEFDLDAVTTDESAMVQLIQDCFQQPPQQQQEPPL